MSPLDGRPGAEIGQVVPCVLVGAALALMPALGFAGEPGPASLSACQAELPGCCGDTALPRLETSVALAYRQAAGRVQADPSLLADLGREQASFLQNRETIAADPGMSLARYMRTWRQWLDAIAPGDRAGRGHGSPDRAACRSPRKAMMRTPSSPERMIRSAVPMPANFLGSGR